MSETIRLVNHFSISGFDAALAVVWQSTLLVAAIAFLLHAWPGLPPAARCWIWRIVAVKLLVMPFWAMQVPVPSQVAPPPIATVPIALESSARSIANGETTVRKQLVDRLTASAPKNSLPLAATPTPLSPQATLALIWLGMVVLQFVRLIQQRIVLGCLIRTTRPATLAVADLVTQCSQELSLCRVPGARIAQTEVSPFVCFSVRPLLVLPASLAADASASQLRQIVLHELAHIRRRDLPWCLVLQLTRIVWWFHPLVHWIAYREALERELACDQLAMLKANVTAADYSRTLVEAASRMAFPAVLRAATAAHFDGGHPLAALPTNSNP